jgi:hypothetical protein
VQSRIAMLDISALAFGLLAIAAFALAICIVIVAAIRLMQCWRFADDAEARQRPALADMGFRRNRLRKVCGDAADLGCVRGNVDGELQPADDFSDLDLRDSARPTLCLSD